MMVYQQYRIVLKDVLFSSIEVLVISDREELKVFSTEVVRFGNRCKDPQWHNLDRYFDKFDSFFTPMFYKAMM